MLFRRIVPGENIPEVTDLKEMNTMLAERATQWTEKWKQAGLQEGIQLGKQENAIAMLTRQLTRRFGPLSPETQTRLQNASLEQLEQWADAILDAKALDEVFANH